MTTGLYEPRTPENTAPTSVRQWREDDHAARGDGAPTMTYLDGIDWAAAAHALSAHASTTSAVASSCPAASVTRSTSSVAACGGSAAERRTWAIVVHPVAR